MKSLIDSQTLQHIKQKLEGQRRNIEGQLARLKNDDPFLSQDRSVVDEPGTVSMEEEGHVRIESNINEAEKLLAQVKKALAKIGIGKYGLCENCGQPIEKGRLEVFPMATLCLSCEKKLEKKR